MSRVNNCILSFDADEDAERIMPLIHADPALRGQKFVDIGELCGGAKVMERPTWAAAFNHYTNSQMLSHLISIPWAYKDRVQLFMCDQHDEEYLYYRIVDGTWSVSAR